MTRKSIILFCLWSAILMTGCSGGLDKEPRAIAVSISTTETKAVYTQTTPSTDAPLSAAVWVSTESHKYPGDNIIEDTETKQFIDWHNSATFTSGSRQLLSHQIYYPSNNTPVYLIGLYPLSGWTTADGTTASFQFDGSQDLMFAPEVSNSYETSANYPTLKFKHLLTWLKINISAQDQETADVWGVLESMTLLSKAKVNINIANAVSEFTGDVTAIPARLVSEDTAITGRELEIPTDNNYFAYLLCCPTEASDQEEEYTLTINTRNRRNVQIPLNLKKADGTDFTGSTAGHQFTVSLKFVQGDNILTSAIVSEWNNGGSILIPVDE